LEFHAVYIHAHLFCTIFDCNRVECISRCENIEINSRLPNISCIHCYCMQAFLYRFLCYSVGCK
jgi:hypothetical protein